MTNLQAEAEKKFGSLRKLALALNVTPGVVHQVAAGHRRAWPKFRRLVSEKLGVPENQIFTEDGWLKRAG